MRRFLKTTTTLLAILAMFCTNVPAGFFITVVRDGNVVDTLWQAYQSGSLDGLLGPERVYAAGSYTEVQNFKCNAVNAWTDMDLSDFGVPASAVVEMQISNNYNSDEQQGGIRANGSSLSRLFDLNEAENGNQATTDSGTGATALVMHVQADSNSIVECFAENPDIVTFKILGWWTCGGSSCYTERFDTLNASVAETWQDSALSGFGVSAGQVVEVVGENSATAATSSVGIRTDGSVLDRQFRLGEAESGGDVTITMNAVAVGATAIIEIFERTLANTSFRLVGYWTSPPGTYNERMQTLTAPGTDNTWTDSNLSAYGVGANDVAEIVLGHGAIAAQNLMGVRTNGSTILRATALPEAENGGLSPSRMHAKADGSSIIELYHEDVSDTPYQFQLVGYWDASNYTESYSFACNARNAWTDMDLSVLGVPGHAVAEVAIGNRYFNDEQIAGIRANGSTWGRSMDISEAEGANGTAADAGNGINYMVMHVQTDANSIVECFAENPDTVDFEVLGYWTCPGGGCYAERFDTLNAAVAATWEDENLSGFSVSSGQVVEVLAENSAAAVASYAGIRTDGSSLERRFDITEAEPGGDRFLTMNAVAVGASAVIEIYEEVLANVTFRLLGYWVDPPGTYTELMQTVTAPGADNTWTDRDLSPYGVGANAVAEMILANGQEATDNRFGVRTNGSSIYRTHALVESEDVTLSSADTNRMLSRMHVPTDASSLIEIIHQDVSDTVYEFQLVGYWTTASAPTVDTDAATLVTPLGAQLNGEITATGGSNATVRGFAWGTNATLQNAFSTTTETGSFGASTFNQVLSGLLSGTTYYFRAYATNPTGTGYGPILNFTAGTDTTPVRTLRLFEGFKIKLTEGRIILYQVVK